MDNSSKLKTYKLIKDSYKQEVYLNLPLPKEDLKMFTKFRISNHNLAIETGRHANKNKSKVDMNNRICDLCNSRDIEDERHFLLHCLKYNNIRKSFMQDIKPINPTINRKSPDELFMYLLTNKDPDILIPLIKFVKKCFIIRTGFIESITTIS